VSKARFEWDSRKDRENQKKHGVSFSKAQFAFADPHRVTGEKSPPQYKPIFDAFQHCQPAAARVIIPNAAHQMRQMNPAAVDAALTKFLLE
jgi:hypothetical protein